MMLREDVGPIDLPTEARPGVAVKLAESGVNDSIWYLVEDSAVAAPAVENEIRSDSPLGQKLLGKKVGDEVVLSDGPGLSRTAVVRELLPKLVFRLRDVWDRWQYRFPEHQELWMVRTPEATDKDEPDFSRVFAVLEENQKRTREADDLYANKLLTVSFLGRLLGQGELRAMGHLAASDTLPVRCCLGSQEEYSACVDALKTSSEIVLDLTALATLIMLDELSALQLLGKTILLTPSSMTAARAFFDEVRRQEHSLGSLGADEGGPRVFAESAEGKRQHLAKMQAFKDSLEKIVKTTGCHSLAELAPTDRQDLEKMMGTSGLESAVVGAGSSRLLWTDDGVTAILAREKFGTRRVWTQGVLRWLNQSGILSNDRYANASAHLLGWRYEFTSVNPEVLRVTACQAEWQPVRRPLKEALEYLARDTVRSQDSATLGAMLVAHCYLDTALPESRHRLVVAMAEALAKRSHAHQALALCRRALPRAFGINAVAREDGVETFDAWLKEWSRRVH